MVSVLCVFGACNFAIQPLHRSTFLYVGNLYWRVTHYHAAEYAPTVGRWWPNVKGLRRWEFLSLVLTLKYIIAHNVTDTIKSKMQWKVKVQSKLLGILFKHRPFWPRKIQSKESLTNTCKAKGRASLVLHVSQIWALSITTACKHGVIPLSHRF